MSFSKVNPDDLPAANLAVYEFIRERSLTVKSLAKKIKSSPEGVSRLFKQRTYGKGADERLDYPSLTYHMKAAIQKEFNLPSNYFDKKVEAISNLRLVRKGGYGSRNVRLIPHCATPPQDADPAKIVTSVYDPQIEMFPAYDYTLTLMGDSMEPTFRAGDVFAIHTEKDYENLELGRVFAVVLEDGSSFIKRLNPVPGDKRKLIVVSDNNKYAPYTIEKKKITYLGKAVGLLRKEP